MTIWHDTMAVSLIVQTGLAVSAWLFARRMTRGLINTLPRPARRFLQHGWLLALWPVSEAAVLAAAGFWSY